MPPSHELGSWNASAPDDSRTLALIADPTEAEVTVREDIAGAKVQVHEDGAATLH